MLRCWRGLSAWLAASHRGAPGRSTWTSADLVLLCSSVQEHTRPGAGRGKRSAGGYRPTASRYRPFLPINDQRHRLLAAGRRRLTGRVPSLRSLCSLAPELGRPEPSVCILLDRSAAFCTALRTTGGRCLEEGAPRGRVPRRVPEGSGGSVRRGRTRPPPQTTGGRPRPRGAGGCPPVDSAALGIMALGEGAPWRRPCNSAGGTLARPLPHRGPASRRALLGARPSGMA